ncbi:hypothetical protein CC2G_014489 [Coprinopsis cinerea AmutBmut pab1-1]|nr:hypothetical protein CC2G_014489 [Coprinopsis cinerea AmutBmut pab1-1]
MEFWDRKPNAQRSESSTCQMFATTRHCQLDICPGPSLAFPPPIRPTVYFPEEVPPFRRPARDFLGFFGGIGRDSILLIHSSTLIGGHIALNSASQYIPTLGSHSQVPVTITNHLAYASNSAILSVSQVGE